MILKKHKYTHHHNKWKVVILTSILRRRLWQTGAIQYHSSNIHDYSRLYTNITRLFTTLHDYGSTVTIVTLEYSLRGYYLD